MGKNTGQGFRRGEVKGRSQLPNLLTGTWSERNAETGRIERVKKDALPFKGVRKER